MDKHYEVQMTRLLRSLTKDTTIVDINVKNKTLNSILNQTARFLRKKCKLCNTQLVDPVGTRIGKFCHYYSCANCGYSEKVK